MAKIISRFNSKGKSIVSEIYHGVENGTIRVTEVKIADGRRLDHYAQEYYGEGLNAWIIAAASGIRWQFGIGRGASNKDIDENESTVIFIPDLNDVIALKNRL